MYEEKLLDFQKHVLMLRKKNGYNLGATPVFFDMPGDTTVNECGASMFQVRTAGVEKQRCTADGHKLIPYVIFKRKTLSKEKLPSGIVVRVQQNGRKTERTFSWTGGNSVDLAKRCTPMPMFDARTRQFSRSFDR